jgi:predicted negative regulator of RcsB-dependent stress response
MSEVAFSSRRVVEVRGVLQMKNKIQSYIALAVGAVLTIGITAGYAAWQSSPEHPETATSHILSLDGYVEAMHVYSTTSK